MTEKEQSKTEVEKGTMDEAEISEITESGQWHTIKEIATKLGYSTAWICALCEQGRIKAVKPLGGRWRIPPEEYERLLKEGIPPLPKEKPRPPIRRIKVPQAAEEKVSPPPVPPVKQEGQKKWPWSLFEL